MCSVCCLTRTNIFTHVNFSQTYTIRKSKYIISSVIYRTSMNMSRNYLIQYVHEHLNFRWIEFTSLALKHACKYDLVTPIESFNQDPYIVIKTCDVESLIRMIKESFLIKGLFELWGIAPSLKELSDQIINSSDIDILLKYFGHQSFRVNVESFRHKLSQTKKVEFIEEMKFLDNYSAKPNLKNPEQIYNIFVHKDKGYYFGRFLTEGNRDLIYKLNLKDRIFIANTSMDPQMSLVCANAAKIKSNDLVYDPFVGSGSLLIGAAHLGAYVMGGDIDWALLHGRSKPSRKSDKIRKKGESIRTNFIQYNILEKYIDVTVSEISKPPLIDQLRFDAIISDPPYGIREGCEKIGSRREDTRANRNDPADSYPAKKTCELKELIAELLWLSAKHLRVGGRLVYFLLNPNDQSTKSFIGQHDSLSLIGYSDQPLTNKTSRSMIVMEKIREPLAEDMVLVPETIDGTKFRELYFSKANKTREYDK